MSNDIIISLRLTLSQYSNEEQYFFTTNFIVVQ